MIERWRSSQWSVGAALLLAAACGAEASRTAPDTTAPSATEGTVVATVPTTKATTTTTAPPPDPAECDRAYSELVAEETARLSTVLYEQAAEQAKRVKGHYADLTRTLDGRVGGLLLDHARHSASRSAGDREWVDSLSEEPWGFGEGAFLASRESWFEAMEATRWQQRADLELAYLLGRDDLAAKRVAELMRTWSAASNELTDWFIQFAGPEGLTRFELQAPGCICGREFSVLAAAQSERVRVVLAGESSRQQAALQTHFGERSLALDRKARLLVGDWPPAGRQRLEVQRRSDEIARELSDAELQVTAHELQRHTDWYLNFHSAEGRRVIEDACNLA